MTRARPVVDWTALAALLVARPELDGIGITPLLHEVTSRG